MSDARTIEIMLDRAAAAWVALCVGVSVMVAGPNLGSAKLFSIACAWAGASGLIVYRLLAGLRGPQHQLRKFELVTIVAVEPDVIEGVEEELLLTADMTLLTTELLLTRGQMLTASPNSAEPLLLEDVLVELRPDSRVVQLFDPERMPTAGELKSRIDRHLSRADRDVPARQEADASQALYDALADLRRSLA